MKLKSLIVVLALAVPGLSYGIGGKKDVKNFTNKKKVGICYDGKTSAADMQKKRKEFLSCKAPAGKECKDQGLKGGKFLKCIGEKQYACLEDICEL